VGTLAADDQDTGDSHTFTLVAGAGDTGNVSFDIVGDELRSAVGFTSAATLSIRVRVNDGAGGTLEQPLTVTVTPHPPLRVTPESEPNDSAATANAVNLSTGYVAKTGAIRPGGDLDWFSFTAPPGAKLWVQTDTGGPQNAGATSRDTVIELFAADGTTAIESDDDDGAGNGGDGTVETGLASVIAGRTLNDGGTYYVRVRAFSTSGVVDPYRLSIVLTTSSATAEVEGNNTAATADDLATPIAYRSAAVSPAGDVDYYAVHADAGQELIIAADCDPDRDGTGTDLLFEIRNEANASLVSVDSSITGSTGNPCAEGVRFAITANGTYYVRVRHFTATGTGTYHLAVAAVDVDT
jgi:hypothetical protein